MRFNYIFFAVAILFLFVACDNASVKNQSEQISGPYLGQEAPGMTPKVFAPGIISSDLYERDFTMTPDGKEIYYTVQLGPRYGWRSHIVCVKEVNGIWTKPEVVSFTNEYFDIEPFIQPDGQKMFFVSNRPLEEGKKNEFGMNMWYVNRTEIGWGKPMPVGEPINGKGRVYYPSRTKDGTLYFVRLVDKKEELVYRSKFVDGKFEDPELLPKQINGGFGQCNVLISPNEDFIVVPAVVEGHNLGGGDYYVSFRDENDNWSELISLGETINTPVWEFCPSLSPDGKYFFFHRERWAKDTRGITPSYEDLEKIHNGGGDIYWVSVDVIKKLNPFK